MLLDLQDKSSPLSSTHVIPTKWRSYRGHRFCDVTLPHMHVLVTRVTKLISCSSPVYELQFHPVQFYVFVCGEQAFTFDKGPFTQRTDPRICA